MIENPPEALRSEEKLVWSYGRGCDVLAMFRAAAAGDTATLSRMLAADPKLVRTHYEYRTPLYFAVIENQVEAARILLEYGSDQGWLAFGGSFLDAAKDRGCAAMVELLEEYRRKHQRSSGHGAAITAAIRARDIQRVRALLEAHPDWIREADEQGNFPIHMAVMTRQLDMIDEVLARGADVNHKRHDGARPIQLANGDYFFRGWRDVDASAAPTPRAVIDHLRARGAYCDICTAAHIGDADRVRELLREDPTLANRASDYVSYYACSGTPLPNAARAGHREIVELLLAAGADPNLEEETIAPYGHALYAAVERGHHEIARLLLEHGAHPNPPVESSADALSRALSNEDTAMIELLCSYGAARSNELMAYYGDVQTAAAVFDANPARANDPDMLAQAASNGHEPLVRLILRTWPSVIERVSCAGKSPELTEWLFRHGMRPDHRNWMGETALHRFAAKGDFRNAKLFVRHGADLNAVEDDSRCTPMGLAAKNGRVFMVQWLLRQGADPDAPREYPWARPVEWARRRGHAEIVAMLEQVERDGVVPAPDLSPLVKLAADMERVYNNDDDASRARLAKYFQRDLPTGEAFRQHVRGRLEMKDGESFADVVARLHGFENWSELVSSATT